jgi:hypothetical protein
MLSSVSSYATHYVAWIVGVTALFVLSAAILSWFVSKRGWLNITAAGARWFKILAAAGALVAGLVIGLVVGVEVGSVKIGLAAVDDVGSRVIDEGLAAAGESLGLVDLREKIDVDMARSALTEFRSVRLLDESSAQAGVVNGVFELVRTPFADKAEELLGRYAPDDEIVLAEVVENSWDGVHAQLNKTYNAVALSRVGSGFVWLMALGLVAVAMAWIARQAADKTKLATERMRSTPAERGD